MKNGKIPVADSNGIIGYHNEATTKGPGITIGRSGNIGTPKFYKNDFWVQRVAKDEENRFLIYPLKLARHILIAEIPDFYCP